MPLPPSCDSDSADELMTCGSVLNQPVRTPTHEIRTISPTIRTPSPSIRIPSARTPATTIRTSTQKKQ